MNSDPLYPQGLLNSAGQISDRAALAIFSHPSQLLNNPIATYLDRLSPASRLAVFAHLKVAVRILSDSQQELAEFPWWKLNYRNMVALRRSLVPRYHWQTVNSILSAVRGTLKESWRLGLMGDVAYRRARSVDGLRGVRMLRGRNVEWNELAAMLDVCRADPCNLGARDAAIIAVLYCTGMRAADIANLEFESYDPDDGILDVSRDKLYRQRNHFIVNEGKAALDAWVAVRGGWNGPLFCQVHRLGKVMSLRLRPSGFSHVISRRARDARIEHLTPHDLRRSFITTLLDLGVDIFTVRDMAGHSQIESTAIYDRRGQQARADATELIALPFEVPRRTPLKSQPKAKKRHPPEQLEKQRMKARHLAWSLCEVWIGQYGWELLGGMAQHGTIAISSRSYGKEWYKHTREISGRPVGILSFPQSKDAAKNREVWRLHKKHYDGLRLSLHRFIQHGLVECAGDPRPDGKVRYFMGYRLTSLGRIVVRVARAARFYRKSFHIRRIRERLEMALEESFMED